MSYKYNIGPSKFRPVTIRNVQFQSFTLEYAQRLMDGDPETEEHFISYFSEALLIKLRHKLRSYEAIDDILQEIFLRVFSALQRRALTTPESLGAFVNGVCNNVLAEYYRSATRHALPLESGSETLGLSPEQEMEAMERKQYVRNVLTGLPQKDREFFA